MTGLFCTLDGQLLNCDVHGATVVEDEFDLTISDAECELLRTVGDVASYLRRLRNLSEEGTRL